MLNVVIGHSNDPNSEAAIVEILEQSDRDLAGKFPKAGILKVQNLRCICL